MTSLLEWDDGDRRFKAERLAAKPQFHLSRKVAPLLPKLAPLFLKIPQLGLDQEEEEDERSPAERLSSLIQFIELSGPLVDTLADMKAEDADYVFDTTLSSVKIETSPGTWMPLWNSAAGRASVLELDGAEKLLPIVVKILVFNLQNFISGFLTSREEPLRASNGGSSPVAKIG